MRFCAPVSQASRSLALATACIRAGTSRMRCSRLCASTSSLLSAATTQVSSSPSRVRGGGSRLALPTEPRAETEEDFEGRLKAAAARANAHHDVDGL
eukprot:8496625-Pyramimonas_sp.AAC.1